MQDHQVIVVTLDAEVEDGLEEAPRDQAAAEAAVAWEQEMWVPPLVEDQEEAPLVHPLEVPGSNLPCRGPDSRIARRSWRDR